MKSKPDFRQLYRFVEKKLNTVSGFFFVQPVILIHLR